MIRMYWLTLPQNCTAQSCNYWANEVAVNETWPVILWLACLGIQVPQFNQLLWITAFDQVHSVNTTTNSIMRHHEYAITCKCCWQLAKLGVAACGTQRRRQVVWLMQVTVTESYRLTTQLVVSHEVSLSDAVKYTTLNWIEQCFTSPPTQYRLYGRRFLQVKRPKQQYTSTKKQTTHNNVKSNNTECLFIMCNP